MGKDLPKPHSWLVTELDFTHMFWLPVRSPFPPHSLVPSRYHLAAQRCERKGGCEVPALCRGRIRTSPDVVPGQAPLSDPLPARAGAQ